MADNELLTVDEMYRADAAAEASGVPSLNLMEAAGQAVFNEIQSRWQPRPVCILAGPGNNGGDGFVVARLLSESAWPVRLGLLGKVENLNGDAAVMAKRWQGETEELNVSFLDDATLVVDALFGAGLTRPLEAVALEVVHQINGKKLECVAVDIPSGVHGDSGEILGAAPQSTVTVTFFRPKPGHYLMPGREAVGELVVADIGIPDTVLGEIGPDTWVNGPDLWLAGFPWPDTGDHKYSRGHAVVVGGAEMTGAARLAAMGARRLGAGLVTITTPPEAFDIYASEEPGTLVKAVGDDKAFKTVLEDNRKNAVLVGPGAGVSEVTCERVLAALGCGKSVVIDADGLSVFESNPETLFKAIKGPCLLTPHEGEFSRLFDITGSKLERARKAARQSDAVIVLKGPDTIIAAPDGRAVINANGTPDLATAGSGDVLAGMALGLMSQGMEVFDAALAAVWLHGALAEHIGPGLIAEDIPDHLPHVLKDLRDRHKLLA